MRFEIINPSDPYTMEADDLEVAAVAVCLLGDGRAVRIDREPRRSFAGLWTAVPGAKDGA